ncbi:MAG: hypothetical protein K2H53_03620 [Clostridia bacterium]|nr:hypothetical protein [Clostridia bacterium]
MEHKNNIDRLLYLKQQKNIVEKARQSIEEFEQITQLQRKVITLFHEKWMKMDDSVEPVQEDIDWYVKEYIIPIQEKQQELDNLENSLISIPEKQSIVGRVGKFFERFIPGITKEGRQRRSIENRRQVLKDEIDTCEVVIERTPFEIFGKDKDIKVELLAKMDVTQLDKYSTVQDDFRNNLDPNSSVKSIADSIKREDMTSLLDSYPALKGEANYLTDELINNGIEAFNKLVSQIVNNCTQKKNELIPQVDFGVQEGSDKDILNDIAQQIQTLMNDLTPEELDELKQIEQQDKLANDELEYNE